MDMDKGVVIMVGGVEEGIKGINADEIRKDKINLKDAIPIHGKNS